MPSGKTSFQRVNRLSSRAFSPKPALAIVWILPPWRWPTLPARREVHNHIRNFLLGIGGVLTYKKSGLDEVIKQIDLKHIVLETDAPYLTPVPFRGKVNEPAFVRSVAEHHAKILGLSLDELASVTTANATALFAL